jgi:hypothetical protein
MYKVHSSSLRQIKWVTDKGKSTCKLWQNWKSMTSWRRTCNQCHAEPYKADGEQVADPILI